MAITGKQELIAALTTRIPNAVREKVVEALERAAGLVLEDMRSFTPLDAKNPGSHARDGLTVIFSENGTRAQIGLPTKRLENDYFWFRFLDGGTKGGEVSYWRNGSAGRKKYVMRVPARPALRIRERALDGNMDEVRRLVAEAVAEGMRE